MEDSYNGDHFQRVSLVQALQELHKRNVSDQHISDKINEAVRKRRNEGISTKHTISRATIQRYRTSPNELMGAREDQVKTVYNFLARDKEFKSSLSRGFREVYSSHVTGPFMYSFIHWLQNPKNSIDLMSLSGFEGSFELYQPAWSAWEDDAYIKMPAQIEKWGTTCHMATNASAFDSRIDLYPAEKQYALLMPCGTNVLMLSQQKEPHVFRLYVIHDMIPYPEADQPIQQFSGNVMTVTGKGPHVSRPFFAERITNSTEDAQIIPRPDLPLKVRRKLSASERTST